MFVTLKDFSKLALAQIVRARDNSAGVELEVLSGERFIADQEEWEKALRLEIRGVLPAPEGYFLLEQVSTENGDFLDQVPIVGWAVSSSGQATPITAAGVDVYDQATLRPDGRVNYREAEYDSLERYALAENVNPGPAPATPI